jgi:ADP-ribose pyrophosphatase
MDDKKLKKWMLVDKKTVWKSKWMAIEDRTYDLPNGKRLDGYYHLNRPDYVLVLAFDKKNRLMLEKQYRRGVDDFVYEVPAGAIDAGETPIEAAKRELKEETGYEAEGDWAQEIYTQAGFSSMKAYVVVLKITNTDGKHSQEHDENIEFEMMTLEQVQEMIADGKVKDMGFLAAYGVWMGAKGYN